MKIFGLMPIPSCGLSLKPRAKEPKMQSNIGINNSNFDDNIREIVAHLVITRMGKILFVFTQNQEAETRIISELEEVQALSEIIEELDLSIASKSAGREPGEFVPFTPGHVYLLSGLDKLNSQDRRALLEALNRMREVIRLSGCQIVVCLRSEMLRDVIAYAPDLWVVRSGAWTV